MTMRLERINHNSARGQSIARLQTEKGHAGPVIIVTVPGKRRLTEAALAKLLSEAAKAAEAE
ncbi:MAG: hypothetical protein K5872_08830 [Rhizobiaceae bacterium]|nr:hypothetical protein [Rhizobiaceae bacterium]MCV0406319.1 hypothetical protein [Rhizobiaceae bacterium]